MTCIRSKSMNSKQYKEIIRPFLSDKRFRHSVYVAEEDVYKRQGVS